MSKKPIDPKLHGIIDYAFSAFLIAVPAILSVNKNAKATYRDLGISFAAMNAFTDTPVGLPLIPMKDHQKADASFVSGFALMALSKPVRKDKRALRFHLCFLTLAFLNYVMTDYDAPSIRETIS